MRKIYILLTLFLAFFGCVNRSYISGTFDFNSMHRIGIMAFSSPDGSFNGAEDVFARELMRRGYTVVERARIEQVLAEQ